MRTSPLWQALETLGGAAPQQDWAQAQGRELGRDKAMGRGHRITHVSISQ